MSAGTLPSEAWIVIGLIVGLAVGQCLAVMANVLEYELGFQKLVREARALHEAVFGPTSGHGTRPSRIRTIAPEPLTDADTEKRPIESAPQPTRASVGPKAAAERYKQSSAAER